MERRIQTRNEIRIESKYALTLEEASAYFGIGITRLRKLISEDARAEYLLMNGTKALIKRKKFETFLDETSSL